MIIYTLLARKEDWEESYHYIASFTDKKSVKDYIKKNYKCNEQFQYRPSSEDDVNFKYTFTSYKKLFAFTNYATLLHVPSDHRGTTSYTLHVYQEEV